MGRQRSPDFQSGRFTKPYLRAANILDGKIDTADVLSMDFDARDFAAFSLRAGDVLVVEGGSVGRSAVFHDNLPGACFQNTVIRFQPDSRLTISEFADYLFRWYFYRGLFKDVSKQTTIAHLGLTRFAAMPYVLPPLPEQRRIVGAIETRFARLDAAIKALERARVNLNRLRVSILKAAVSGRLVPSRSPQRKRSGVSSSVQPDSFYPLSMDSLPASWNVAYLHEIADEVQSGFASGDHNSDGRGIPHLRMMNITREGNLDLSRLEFVPRPKATRIRKGEILFTNTNSLELVGKTALFDRDGEWSLSNHMTRIRLRQGFDPSFFARQLHYLWMEGYFRHRCTRHVNQASFGTEALSKSVPLVFPTLSEQRQIVEAIEARLSVVDQVSMELHQGFERCSRLRESILKMAFEGRLVTQDPNDEPASALLERIKTTSQVTSKPVRRPRRLLVAE